MTSRIRIRAASFDDISAILKVEEDAWPEGLRASEEMFRSRIQTFPGGTLVVEVDGRIEGIVVTQIVQYDLNCGHPPTWPEITDNGSIRRSHNPNGNVLYGVDLSVTRYADRRVAPALLEGVKRLAIALNLARVVFGARIPRYHRHVSVMSVEEYIHATDNRGRPIDPEIFFYVKGGAEVIRPLPGYFPDPVSLGYGVLMVWENPAHKPNIAHSGGR